MSLSIAYHSAPARERGERTVLVSLLIETLFEARPYVLPGSSMASRVDKADIIAVKAHQRRGGLCATNGASFNCAF